MNTVNGQMYNGPGRRRPLQNISSKRREWTQEEDDSLHWHPGKKKEQTTKKDILSRWKPNSATEMRMLILALRVSPVAPGHDDLNSSRYQSTILCQDVLSGEEEGKT